MDENEHTCQNGRQRTEREHERVGREELEVAGEMPKEPLKSFQTHITPPTITCMNAELFKFRALQGLPVTLPSSIALVFHGFQECTWLEWIEETEKLSFLSDRESVVSRCLNCLRLSTICRDGYCNNFFPFEHQVTAVLRYRQRFQRIAHVCETGT